MIWFLASSHFISRKLFGSQIKMNISYYPYELSEWAKWRYLRYHFNDKSGNFLCRKYICLEKIMVMMIFFFQVWNVDAFLKIFNHCFRYKTVINKISCETFSEIWQPFFTTGYSSFIRITFSSLTVRCSQLINEMWWNVRLDYSWQ